jgi:hypothetical protein
MVGNLEFEGSSQIKAKGTSNLDGRASLLISGASEKPIAIDSGSSYLPALSIFGYDASSPNNRKQVIDLKANGRIDAANSIVSKELFKSTRNTGYAFEAKPNDATTSAFIHTNGSASFTNKLEILKTQTNDHAGFTIYGTEKDGTEGKVLDAFHNGGSVADAVNYNGRIDNSSNLVNKGYVDSVLSGPARLAWKYDTSGSGSSGPSAGKFYFDGTYLRISFETANGIELNDSLMSDTNSVNLDYGPMLTAWYLNTSNGKWRLKRIMRCQTYRWNYNGHFEFKESSGKGTAWNGLTNDVKYYLTVGGFF